MVYVRRGRGRSRRRSHGRYDFVFETDITSNKTKWRWGVHAEVRIEGVGGKGGGQHNGKKLKSIAEKLHKESVLPMEGEMEGNLGK